MQTTLSVIDLAEFSNTVPEKLSAFSKSVSNLLEQKEYQKVSDARYGTREFATSNRIDQIDLAHLALNVGTSEGKALADTIQKAVKYNRTSSNMTNAYGVSIFFPYRNSKYVAPACNTYSQINMNSEYTKCIRQFASLQTSGQIASGSSGSPLESLLGMGGGGRLKAELTSLPSASSRLSAASDTSATGSAEARPVGALVNVTAPRETGFASAPLGSTPAPTPFASGASRPMPMLPNPLLFKLISIGVSFFPFAPCLHATTN